MRKIRIGAVAALSALAVTGAAGAQTAQEPAGAELTTAISPSDAGTRTRPKPIKVSLTLKNEDSSQTADRIQVYIAKQIRVSTSGIKKCSAAKLERDGKSACSMASRVGNGTADAIAGVNTASPAPLKFNISAFVIGDNQIGFYLEQQGGEIRVLAKGRFKSASGRYGRQLDIPIPQLAREFPPGTYNGLVGLKTDLYKKVGSKALFKSTGCTSTRELPFRLTLSFMPNPAPPKAETVTATDGANCSK